MSKKIIVGNWKMNPPTAKEAEKLFGAIAKAVTGVKKTEVVICPPFIYLDKLIKIRTDQIKLGAQNAFWMETGAFTGEISPTMLYNAGVKYVILGHSERRNPSSVNSDSGGENNNEINKKIKASLSTRLVPILCVGESERDESHSYFNLIKNQAEECLNGVSKNLISKVIIAYEPVWAISSTVNRRDATAADSREMAVFIRKILSDKFGSEARKVKIIYGGSANEKDAKDFLQNGGVDGLLAGRASLDALKFGEIVKICEALNQ